MPQSKVVEEVVIYANKKIISTEAVSVIRIVVILCSNSNGSLVRKLLDWQAVGRKFDSCRRPGDGNCLNFNSEINEINHNQA